MQKLNFSSLRTGLLAGALTLMGGCAYGPIDGSAYGDGYINGVGYACDPYAQFDDYYACDNGFGYANIGFGGGWYQDYYYPGYGVYGFDRRGYRHALGVDYRRYWAQRRYEYAARNRDGYRRDGRDGDRRWRGGDLTPEQRAERRDQRVGSERQRGGERGYGYRNSPAAVPNMGSGAGAAPNGAERQRQAPIARGNATAAPVQRAAPPVARAAPPLATPRSGRGESGRRPDEP
ncbi:MAG: hypothetical protein U5J78_01215 [Parasphingorhabdus sp.]|nr:hypothetical protein [Parasphingorhabdus sp.]